MALKGNLRDFTITQLLNLINLARKTGTLVIEGPSEVARVSFRDGKLAYSKLGSGDNSLATILYRAKKLTQAGTRLRAWIISIFSLSIILRKAVTVNKVSGDFL